MEDLIKKGREEKNKWKAMSRALVRMLEDRIEKSGLDWRPEDAETVKAFISLVSWHPVDSLINELLVRVLMDNQRICTDCGVLVTKHAYIELKNSKGESIPKCPRCRGSLVSFNVKEVTND